MYFFTQLMNNKTKRVLLQKVQKKVFDIVQNTQKINVSTAEIVELFRQLEQDYQKKDNSVI